MRYDLTTRRLYAPICQFQRWGARRLTGPEKTVILTEFHMRGPFMVRPSWDEYFIEITRLVAKRSTCLRRQVGAVLVKDKNILATGYNGAPSGTSHCLDIGCLREKLNIPSGERHELCRGLHAEQNAIIQAAKHGTSIEGATLYCNTMPCIICSKMVINAGIKRVVYLSGYPDQLAEEMIRESGVIVEKFEEGSS
jgi:dCMP deaminase